MRKLFTTLSPSSIGAAFGVLVSLLAFQPAAQAANPLEMNFWLSGPRYDGNVPSCESALDTISSRFSAKEGQFWNSGLQITGFSDVREVAFRPWASNTIPRRFCSAHAMLSDGRARQVHYSIIEDGGFSGYGSDVEWCVTGLDRNWAYNPACKSARP
ncbi:MAG: hypothetical protein AB1586_18730 [Pseudomonadota bacterium]